VQISPETYAHLTESEEKVKNLEENVKVLNEKLSAAHSEITTKDALVKQHAKVAEEAVSGTHKITIVFKYIHISCFFIE
jgi:type IV secretory pathway VirD2 relaxase